MRLKGFLLAGVAVSVAVISVPARADHHYVSLFGGLSVPETARAHYIGSSAYDISRDTGYVIGGALGTNLWSDRWRGELELAYARSDVSDVFERYDGLTHEAFGDLAHLTLLANLWRDFAVPAADLHPYIGGGLGVALNLSDWCFDTSGDSVCEAWHSYRTSEPALAAQAGFGVRFGLSDRLMLDLGYRLRAAIGADMAANGINPGGSPPGWNSMIGADFLTHSVQAGLSFAPGGLVETSGEDEDWYLSLFGGLSIPETTRAHYFGGSAYDISRDRGYVVGGALGTTLWNDRWRGELELAYARSNVADVVERWNSSTHEAFGNLAHLTLLANLWRDFTLPVANLHPYLGGGLGVAVNLPDWCFDENGDAACEDEHSYSTSELALAGQAGVGARFAMSDHLMLDLGYARSDVSEVFDRDDGLTYEALGDLAHLTLLANLWRDFTLPAANLHPYLGGGLGVALTLPDWCADWDNDGECIDNDDGIFDTSELALAAQAGAGVRFAMSDRLMLDLGYRLRAVIGADMAGNYVGAGSPPGCCSLMGADFITHSFQAGLSFAPGGIVEPSGGDERWYVSLFGGLSIPETTRAHYFGGSAYDISRDTG